MKLTEEPPTEPVPPDPASEVDPSVVKKSMDLLTDYLQRREQQPSLEVQAKRARLLKILSDETSTPSKTGDRSDEP